MTYNKMTTQHNDTQHNDTQHNDTQHNDNQHNDTQHNDTQRNDNQHNDTEHNDIQQYNKYNATLSIMSDHCYAECRLCYMLVMLSTTYKPFKLCRYAETLI